MEPLWADFSQKRFTKCQQVSRCAKRDQSGLNANVSNNLVFSPIEAISLELKQFCVWRDMEDIKFESRCLSRGWPVTTSQDCKPCPRIAATGRGFMTRDNLSYGFLTKVTKVLGYLSTWLPGYLVTWVLCYLNYLVTLQQGGAQWPAGTTFLVVTVTN